MTVRIKLQSGRTVVVPRHAVRAAGNGYWVTVEGGPAGSYDSFTTHAPEATP